MSYFLLRLSCLQQGEGKVFVFSQVRIQQRTNRIRYLVISCLYGGRSNEGNFLKLCKLFQSYCCFFNCVTFNIQDWYAVHLLENVLKSYWKRFGFLKTEAGITVGNIVNIIFPRLERRFRRKRSWLPFWEKCKNCYIN